MKMSDGLIAAVAGDRVLGRRLECLLSQTENDDERGIRDVAWFVRGWRFASESEKIERFTLATWVIAELDRMEDEAWDKRAEAHARELTVWPVSDPDLGGPGPQEPLTEAQRGVSVEQLEADERVATPPSLRSL